MKPTDERPNRIPWPPIVVVGLAVSALVLDALIPLPFPGGMARDILAGAGFILMMAAVVLYLFSARELNRHRTTIMPHRGSNALVTSGPYAFSRNPIYLANVMLLAGFGLAVASLWMVLAAIASGIAEYHVAIKREEAHLEHKFAKAWRDYKKRVRRWI